MVSTAKRVLVVDDDADIQQLIGILLRRIGMEAIRADRASAAIQILRTQSKPDLMILDLMMPEVSGLELLQHIRAIPEYNDLPVLVLSALIESEDIRTALGAGADRYLTKPYIANNLVTIVQDLLRSGRRNANTASLS